MKPYKVQKPRQRGGDWRGGQSRKVARRIKKTKTHHRRTYRRVSKYRLKVEGKRNA